MANKDRYLSGKRKLAPLTGLSTDRHVYLSPEETEPNLGFVGEKILPLKDEYYQLVSFAGAGQYDLVLFQPLPSLLQVMIMR